MIWDFFVIGALWILAFHSFHQKVAKTLQPISLTALLLHFRTVYVIFLHNWTRNVRPCTLIWLFVTWAKHFSWRSFSPGGVLISPSFWAPFSTSTDHLSGMNQLDSNMSRESSSPIRFASSDLTIPVRTSSAMLGNLTTRYLLSGVELSLFKKSSEWVILTVFESSINCQIFLLGNMMESMQHKKNLWRVENYLFRSLTESCLRQRM